MVPMTPWLSGRVGNDSGSLRLDGRLVKAV